MANADEFESLYKKHKGALERFVRFRIGARDADDVVQETAAAAFLKFAELRSKDAFLPWILSIARNKCRDAYRSNARSQTVALDEDAVYTMPEAASAAAAVREILAEMSDADSKLLTMAYLEDAPLASIAGSLGIPLGTVKSRLHSARKRFRRTYEKKYYAGRADDAQNDTEESNMKRSAILPDIIPAYKIAKSDAEPFSVVCEELMGWMIVPREGERLTWGLYDSPSGRRTEWTELEVVGRASIHGVDGVEIRAVQHDAENYYRTGSIDECERRFIAQATDTHCRFLAESHIEDGVRRCYTFLDGDDSEFIQNWGFGPDNCGFETHLSRKGIVTRDGGAVTCAKDGETLDIVGRYSVEIAGKVYDTVCMIDVGCFSDSVVSEQFIDKNGRTVLWRRFNRDDWAYGRYGRRWTEMLPENERLTVNGEVFVHWYDCISDYIL